MNRSAIGVALAIVIGAVSLPWLATRGIAAAPVQRTANPAGAAGESGAEVHRATLTQYCVTCHNQRLKTANLSLDVVDIGNVAGAPAVWEKVALKLRSGTMPPDGRPRPSRQQTAALWAWLEAEIDRAAAAHPDAGRPASVHRLNRAEYANAIADLLALETDVRTLLPPDDSGYGFDNIGDVLTISPTLLERYLSAARKVSRAALGDPTLRPAMDVYAVHKYARQDQRMGDDLPFGSRAGLAVRHFFPVDGEYVIRVRLLRTYRDEVRGLALDPHQLEIRLDGAPLQQFTIGGAESAVTERTGGNADAALTVKFNTTAGARMVAVSFVQKASDLVPEGILQPILPVTSYEYAGNEGALPGIESVDVSGPFSVEGSGGSPSRRRIFTCHPGLPRDPGREDACAQQVLGAIARRAYRRPVDESDLQPLMTLFRDGRRDSFDAGIGRALQKILITPDFLFRIERDPADAAPGVPYRVSDLELASRLSFFLWSSIPDDELLDVAARGRLHDARVLDQQVRRMLADRRAVALVGNFASQWLATRNLRVSAPDPMVFPQFDENLRQAFDREIALFLESQLRGDRPVGEMLEADYTFVNERLAEHYGIPNVQGDHFRRVMLTDEARWGLLGKGGILTMTSYANRTSPVIRGKWLLENILGSPPPDPPPDVPPLREASQGQKALTMRERMAQHRTNPACASCHQMMDPLGFALEPFDAIGRWRASDGGTPIDASGELADGSKLDGPQSLRRALVARHDDFVRTVTKKLLTYALGRGVEDRDGPAVREILRNAGAQEYRWSALVSEITRSVPFQMRMPRPAAAPSGP